jgi:hypothetical protein
VLSPQAWSTQVPPLAAWGLLCTATRSLPDAPSPSDTAAETPHSQGRSSSAGSQSLFLPSDLIHFIIDFSSLMRLSLGKRVANDRESRSLCDLCSSFYPSNFMQLEPCLPLSWRNVGVILNHRMQAGDRRTLVTHLLTILQAPKLSAGRHHPFRSLCALSAWLNSSALLHNSF